jgi:hypothetical protein
MTTSDVAGAILRRWYVAVLVLLCTVAAGFHVAEADGVYLSRVSVRFLAPAGTQDNAFVSSSASLVATAGLVERSLRANPHLAATASPTITLADRGLRREVVVTLPDAGGQFTHLFREPVLDVQSVAPRAQDATTSRDGAVREIREELRSLQERQGVPGRDRIVTKVIAPAGTVAYVHGHRSRALAAVLALGVGLTLFLCGTVDLMFRRRKQPARRPPSPTAYAA